MVKLLLVLCEDHQSKAEQNHEQGKTPSFEAATYKLIDERTGSSTDTHRRETSE